MIHELMLGCPWAQNRSKLERAIKEVRGDNPETGVVGRRDVSEEAVKEVYIRLLGHVLPESEQVPVEVPEEEAPRRRGRK